MSEVRTSNAGPECIVEIVPRCDCGESPLWDPDTQRLFWIDIPNGRIHALSSATANHQSWQLPEAVGCIARHASGGLLAACRTGIYALDTSRQRSVPRRIATLPHADPHMRANDGKPDRQGRLWVSTMGIESMAGEPLGCLHRFDAKPYAQDVGIGGMIVPNGIAFSPDGRRMYLSDSHHSRRKVWCFDYDQNTGTPGQRREFLDLGAEAGRPDGATVDAAGGYWLCGIDGGYVSRYTPDGRLDQRITLPTRTPTSCIFGGAGMNTLFITSLQRTNSAQSDAYAGCLMALKLDVAGIADAPVRWPDCAI